MHVYSETSETDDNYSEHFRAYTKKHPRHSAFRDVKQNFNDTYRYLLKVFTKSSEYPWRYNTKHME